MNRHTSRDEGGHLVPPERQLTGAQYRVTRAREVDSANDVSDVWVLKYWAVEPGASGTFRMGDPAMLDRMRDVLHRYGYEQVQ